MVDQTTPLRNVKVDANDAVNRVKTEIDHFINTLDFRALTQKIQDFGTKKPVVLAVAALTVGLAAGMLMRRTTNNPVGNI